MLAAEGLAAAVYTSILCRVHEALSLYTRLGVLVLLLQCLNILPRGASDMVGDVCKHLFELFLTLSWPVLCSADMAEEGFQFMQWDGRITQAAYIL